MNLEEIRKKIDYIDNELLSLIAERMSLIPELAQNKTKNNLQLKDSEREEEIISSMIEKAEGLNLNPNLIKNVYKELIDGSYKIQKNITYFSLPAKWDKEALKKILDGQTLETRIIEVYGCMNVQPISHGRPKGATDNVSIEQVAEYFNFTKSQGITTNYLLNGKLIHGLSSEVTSFLDIIGNKVKPDMVTISQIELMEFFSKNYPNIPINVSTIAGTRTIKDMQKWVQMKRQGMNIYKIVLHNDATKNPALKEIVDLAHDKNILVELMVNECCRFNCADRAEHYGFFDQTHKKEKDYDDMIDNFAVGCALYRLNPENVLDIVGYVDPRDVSYYKEKHGIDRFKIVGRGRSIEEIGRFAELYLSKKPVDNIFSIVQFTTPKHPDNTKTEDIFYLNADAYSKIHENPDKRLTLEEREKFAQDLIKDGSLKINDLGNRYQKFLNERLKRF